MNALALPAIRALGCAPADPEAHDSSSAGKSLPRRMNPLLFGLRRGYNVRFKLNRRSHRWHISKSRDSGWH